jgi:hypothetical protein
VVLQLTRCGIKGVTHGDIDIVMRWIAATGVADRQFVSRRLQFDQQAIKQTRMLTARPRLDDDVAAREPIMKALQLSCLLAKPALERRRGFHAVETDLYRYVHRLPLYGKED